MKHVIGAVLLALASLGSAHAADWAWEDDPISDPFLVNPAGFPSAVGSATEIEAAMEGALRTWNVEGDASVFLAYDGQTSDTAFGGTDDGQNLVHAQATGTGTDLVTTQVTVEALNTDDIIDCDIRFHTTNGDGAVDWSADPLGATTGVYDLERALLREMGRCLGLEEADSDTSVMRPVLPDGTGPEGRHLAAEDTTALQALYGEAEVVFEHYTHAVLYDIDDENGDHRGAPGEEVLVQATVRNLADTAIGLTGSIGVTSSTATLEVPVDVQDLGDLLNGEVGQLYNVLTIVDCFPNANTVTFEVNLEDARGDTYQVSFDTWIQCADPSMPNNEEEEPDGCGCASGPAIGWWPVVALLALLPRRRTPRSAGRIRAG
ncbi:MAG: hypothetical protein JRI25_06815 [Deltaproteobacteria bacterium]|nr:hypothetical protein [Deltaproteobacteria bacterium]